MICIFAPFNPSTVSQFFDTCTELPVINQTATSVNNLVISFLERGEKVIVVTTSISTKNKLIIKSKNIEIIIVSAYRNFILSRLFPNIHYLANVIADAINPELSKITVIHAHWCYEYALAALKFKDKLPVYCTVRDWAPIIYDSISPFQSVYSFFAKLYWKYKIHIMNEVINSNGMTFIANSQYTSSLLKSRGINNLVISNSIEDSFILYEIPKITCRKNIISIASSLDDSRKNIVSLIRAFVVVYAKYSDLRLILVGDYHRNGRVYLEAKKFNLLDKIMFTGRLNRSELVNYIDSSFCMVHPAVEETFGNILIESMARGIPCIGGFSSGAVPYVLDNGVLGVVCDVLSPLSISNSIKYVLENEEQVTIFREKALNNVKKFYANSVIVEKYLSLYNH